MAAGRSNGPSSIDPPDTTDCGYEVPGCGCVIGGGGSTCGGLGGGSCNSACSSSIVYLVLRR